MNGISNRKKKNKKKTNTFPPPRPPTPHNHQSIIREGLRVALVPISRIRDAIEGLEKRGDGRVDCEARGVFG